MNERLIEIVNKGLEYYNSDPRNEFGNHVTFNTEYNREQRLAIIRVIEAEIKKFPLLALEDTGFGKFVLDVDNMTIEQRNLVKYITLELNAKTLRGTKSKCKLQQKDLPHINKWNPWVMYILAEEHGLQYNEFIVRNNNGKYFLGKDLMSLLIIIDESETNKVSKYGVYLVNGFTGKIMKNEITTPDDSDREEVTDHKEDRINYSHKENQIIKKYSPWTIAFSGEYTKDYEETSKRYKLSKEFMEENVMYGIKNKTRYEIPEGCEF